MKTLAWTGAGILMCVVFFASERVIDVPRAYRMFRYPAETAMRIFGFAHFAVALYFLLSSRRMRSPRAVLGLASLVPVALALAAGFTWLGGIDNPLMLLAVYFYFFVHDFRDLAFFYKCSGDCRDPRPAERAGLFSALQVMLMTLLLPFVVPTYFEYLAMHGELPRDDPVLAVIFPASVPFLTKFAAYLAPVLVLNAGIFWHVAQRYPGGWRAIGREHGPLLAVFGGYGALVLSGLVLGHWSLHYAVLAHFVGWYLFALGKLRTAPPARRTYNPLRWMRRSPVGFAVLHLGVAAAAGGLMAVSAYGFAGKGVLASLTGETSFYCWTILHITLSFIPR
ncbi:MAG: hypothetical protein ACOC46_01680 [Pirellulales bacterium]